MQAPFRIRVKICCISSLAEAQLAIRLGADALGLVGSMPSGPVWWAMNWPRKLFGKQLTQYVLLALTFSVVYEQTGSWMSRNWTRL